MHHSRFIGVGHRVQVFPASIDQYFCGGFSPHIEYYQGVPWKYGRFDKTPWKGLNRLDSAHEASNGIDICTDRGVQIIKDLRTRNFIVLGSVCTHEKYVSRDFWLAIDEILSLVPNAVYCFSGRKVLSSKDTLLISRDRIIFTGWHTNVNLIQMFDMYLDAFPFGSSHVLYQSWCLHKPTISLFTAENMPDSFHSIRICKYVIRMVLSNLGV